MTCLFRMKSSFLGAEYPFYTYLSETLEQEDFYRVSKTSFPPKSTPQTLESTVMRNISYPSPSFLVILPRTLASAIPPFHSSPFPFATSLLTHPARASCKAPKRHPFHHPPSRLFATMSFSNTDTGSKPADPYKAKNLDEPSVKEKVEGLNNFISACKFGMMTTRIASSGLLVSRCMAVAGKVSSPLRFAPRHAPPILKKKKKKGID